MIEKLEASKEQINKRAKSDLLLKVQGDFFKWGKVLRHQIFIMQFED